MKPFFILSILLIYFQTTKACDVCGCSIGNGFSAILPQFQKNFVGIRTTLSNFESNSIHTPYSKNKESSVSIELWTRIYLHKKIQLIASLPYNFNTQVESNLTHHINGLGDAVALINYSIINRNQDSLKWKHLLLAGVGLKLPTGKFLVSTNNSEPIIGLQTGTGSLDYLYNLIYTIRHNRWGSYNQVLYQYNLANKVKYEFGNKLNIHSKVFYWHTLKNASNLLPSFGVSTDKVAKDYKEGYVQSQTGGFVNSLTLGCDWYYKSYLFSCNYYQPIYQNLGEGTITAKNKLQINASLLF